MPPTLEFDQCLTAIPTDGAQPATLLLPESVKPPGIKTLSAWFRALNDLQNLNVSPYRFFESAARAISVPGGLSGAHIIARSKTKFPGAKGHWMVSASDPEALEDDSKLRWDLIQQVETTKETLFHSADKFHSLSQNDDSLGLWDQEGPKTAVVIAPIVNAEEVVEGFVYGWRKLSSGNQRKGVRELEAHFVKLVAQTLGSMLERSRKQEELAGNKALLDLTFPIQIAEKLQVDPTILAGQQKNITALFADLRGFSTLTNRLDAKITYELVVEVMDQWTEIVHSHSGSVVDYYGDGLMAFWNAPLEIENHATLATSCGRAIQASLANINQSWKPVTDFEMKAGVGIATGISHVGNCGSRHRIKYGPHGQTVNLAARMEKLTKELGCPLLVSKQTACEIEADYLVRRICKAKIAGFERPIDVYSPIDPDSVDQVNMIYDYEFALSEFEHGNLTTAKEAVVRLLGSFPNDAICKALLQSIDQARSSGAYAAEKTTFLQLNQ